LLKLRPGFGRHLPDWFQKSSRKGEREHRHQAEQCAGTEEDDEHGDADRSAPPGGFEFQ